MRTDWLVLVLVAAGCGGSAGGEGSAVQGIASPAEPADDPAARAGRVTSVPSVVDRPGLGARSAYTGTTARSGSSETMPARANAVAAAGGVLGSLLGPPPTTCGGALCPAGTRCVIRAPACATGPCPPQYACEPDADAGAAPPVDFSCGGGCLPGEYCALEAGGSRCVPYRTCLDQPCQSGERCFDMPTRCMLGVCPPSLPLCLPPG